MILKILKYPNYNLKKKCERINEITPEIKNLGEQMIKIMVENNGVGLASSQVGIPKRIIAINTQKGPKLFINPEIIGKSKEEEIKEEGCLSFPGLYLKIKRAKEVDVKAKDLNNKEFNIKTKGQIARIFQHEIDHLGGILFIDKLNFLQKLKLKKKWI